MSSLMLKRCAAEFMVTFALVFFGCGTRAFVGDVQNFAGILAVHIAFGFTVAAMIYTLSHISSAQFNPAITLGFAISRHFPWRYVFPHCIAEFAPPLLPTTTHLTIFPQHPPPLHHPPTTPKHAIIHAIAIDT